MIDSPQWPHTEGPKHHHEHDDAARAAADDAHVAVEEDREAALLAVDEAREAVAQTAETLGGLVSMLERHFQLGLIAVATGMVVGFGLLMFTLSLRNTQQAVNLQAKINEIAEIRGQVKDREGDHRLCVVALGASRPADVAEQICAPVLGEDYDDLKGKLARLERRLVKARNGG